MGSIYGTYNATVDIEQAANHAKETFSQDSRHRGETFVVPDRPLFFGIYRSKDGPSNDGFACVDGSAAVFSGNIVNFQDLCRRFEFTRNETTCAGLFLEAYRKFGLDVASKINGLFSAAVWDAGENRLTVFSDRIGGFYTVFYTVGYKSFSFANRLPFTLELAGVPREGDRRALNTFFQHGYVLPPHTFAKNVSKNWPGEAVVFDGETVKREFVDLPPSVPTGGVSRSVDELEDVLRESLRGIMSQGRELGFLLSGGIDSSSLVAMASEISPEPLETFSAGFPGTVFDESPYAVMVAEKYGCRSHVLDMTRGDGMEYLPAITWWHNEPTLDYSCLPTHAIFSRVREHFPAVVGGDGPDHFFGRYYPIAAKQSVRYLRPMFRLAYALTRKDYFNRLAYGAGRNLTDAYMDLFAVPSWGTASNPPVELLLTSQTEGQPYPFDPVLPGDWNRKSHSYEELFHRTACLDMLVDGAFGVFKKVGCMAQACDMNLHAPFMDRRVQDFILALPRRERVNGGLARAFFARAKTKYLLKFGMGPRVLPPEVVTKNKGGFTPPLVTWLKESVCRIPAEKLLSPELRDAGLFHTGFIDRMLNEHRNGERNWTILLFMLLSYDLWYQTVICKGLSTPPQFRYSEWLENHGAIAES